MLSLLALILGTREIFIFWHDLSFAVFAPKRVFL